MTAQPIDRGAPLRLASKVILVAGLLAGVVIYATAPRPADNPLGDLEDSKVYLRQMQLYGGEANVIGYEIRQWIGSLWHGKRLGFTVAVLGALVAGGCRFAAIPLPPADGSDEEAVEGSGGGQDG
jgi:hypothetical protein